MPSSRASRFWIYASLKPTPWNHIGKKFYGVVFGRMPIIAFYIDDSWYEGSISFGLSFLYFDVGCFYKQHNRSEIIEKNHDF